MSTRILFRTPGNDLHRVEMAEGRDQPTDSQLSNESRAPRSSGFSVFTGVVGLLVIVLVPFL